MPLRNIQTCRSIRGQSSLELGIALLVLVVLLLGLVDVGHLLYHSITLENGARQGVRIGIMGYPDSAIVAAIQEATSTLDPSRLRWSITPAEGQPGRSRGGILTVDLWYDDRPPMPLAGLFENPHTLHACRKGKILSTWQDDG